jgi:predicted HicB family RNase H-like nuclease
MKKKNKRATVNINVQISPALKGDILAAAKADDRNLSSWIRKVLSDAIIKNVKF